jgi:branched-chain amino acid transport system substrate-binding protein
LCAKLGIEVVYDDYFPPGTKDMSPFLVSAIAKKPDVFYNCASSGAYWGLLIKQARDLGYQGLFADGHPPTPKQTGEIAGMRNVQGMIGFGYASEGKLAPEGVLRFREDYIKKFGEWHEHSLVLLAIDAIFMAFEEAGTLDVEKVVSILESGKEWKTPVGITGTFGGTNRYGHPHQWFAPQYVIEIQGDKAVPIDIIAMKDMLD